MNALFEEDTSTPREFKDGTNVTVNTERLIPESSKDLELKYHGPFPIMNRVTLYSQAPCRQLTVNGKDIRRYVEYILR